MQTVLAHKVSTSFIAYNVGGVHNKKMFIFYDYTTPDHFLSVNTS